MVDLIWPLYSLTKNFTYHKPLTGYNETFLEHTLGSPYRLRFYGVRRRASTATEAEVICDSGPGRLPH